MPGGGYTGPLTPERQAELESRNRWANAILQTSANAGGGGSFQPYDLLGDALRREAVRGQQQQQASQATLFGGYDPETGITWNQGRSLMSPAQTEQQLAQAFPQEFGKRAIQSYFPDPGDPTGAQKDAIALGLQPGSQAYNDYIRERTLKSGVTVNVGDQLPKPPSGFYYRPGSQPGSPELAPIPGGPEAQKAERARRGERAQAETRSKKAQLVVEDIDRILELSGGDIPVTGIFSLAQAIPGSSAADVASLLNTIRANVGFDQLQRMREESDTGGALGQVSENENLLLQSVLGSLEQSQSQEQFRRNLQRLKEVFEDIIYTNKHAPVNYTPDQLQNMSDEEFRSLLQ